MTTRRKRGATRPKRAALAAMNPVRQTFGLRNRVHHQMLAFFAIAAIALVLLNVLVYSPVRVQATASDNVDGWAWSSTGGWLSMNDTNVGAGGGSYGVNVNTGAYPKAISGYAWSTHMGWVCFGAPPTCPAGDPPGAAVSPFAQVDAAGNITGWAQVLNLGSGGWLSLNCSNTGACGVSPYKVMINFTTGQWTGWGWNAPSGGTGWGWFNFDGVRMSGIEDFTLNPPMCVDGIDNDADSAIDCADVGCIFQEPACPATETNCALIGQTNCCYNGFDDDFDGLGDCIDADCSASPACMPETQCTDGLDNDFDGLFDCTDADCLLNPACLVETICDDGLDDEPDGPIDCDDSDCAGNPACTPAWLKSNYGNVYATIGIEGNAPPPGEANATYCLSSGGDIINFQSAEGCEEAFETNVLTLPSGGTGYVSNLGRLDVNGILSGRYAPVVQITNESGLQNPMSGKVFVYDGDVSGCGAPFNLTAKTWLNGSGAGGRGNGLLVIKGCNLRITGDLTYQAGGVSSYLRNLASFGILVLAKYTGGVPQPGTGEVLVAPSVSQIVGAIYAERAIRTGSTGSANTDIQLTVYGALVSREVDLERLKSTPTAPAELVEFDGRAVVNPPPGYQDISKSLPALTDTFQ